MPTLEVRYRLDNALQLHALKNMYYHLSLFNICIGNLEVEMHEDRLT